MTRATLPASCIQPNSRAVWYLVSTVSIELFSLEPEAFAHEIGAHLTKQTEFVLDRAGWRHSTRENAPEHIYLLFLPPPSPELKDS